MGATNLLNGTLCSEVDAAAVKLVDTDIGPILCSFSRGMPCGCQVVISVRPENIKITKENRPEENNVIDGRVSTLRSVLKRLDDADIDVESLTVHTPDLDDVFFALTGKKGA